MKQKPLWIKIIVFAFPFAVISFVYLFRNSLIYVGTIFPACPSKTFLNVYCPGCGNTRSVTHLLSGDIAGSIRYNPAPVIGIILLILAYIELVTYTFGMHKRLIPRSRKFWITFTIVMSVFYVFRNFIRPF